MPMQVVHYLEVVEVDEEHTQVSLSPTASERSRETAAQRGPVEKPCQSVAQGQPGKVGLDALAFCQVGRQQD